MHACANPIHRMPCGIPCVTGVGWASSALKVTNVPIPHDSHTRPASSRKRWTFQLLRLASCSSGGRSTPFSIATNRSRNHIPSVELQPLAERQVAGHCHHHDRDLHALIASFRSFILGCVAGGCTNDQFLNIFPRYSTERSHREYQGLECLSKRCSKSIGIGWHLNVLWVFTR